MRPLSPMYEMRMGLEPTDPVGTTMTQTHRRWDRSIGFRFTILTLLLVLLLSLLVIVGEGTRSYRREVARLNAQIAQIEQSHVPSIVSSLWLTDYELLERQLQAIQRFPYVARVEVTTDEGARYYAGGPADPRLTVRAHPLVYTRREAEVDVGAMRLFVDQRRLQTEALQSEVLSALGYALVAFVTSGVVALLFHRQVGRHVERLAAHAQASTEPDSVEPFELERSTSHHDELDRLVTAINGMREGLIGRMRERELLMRESYHRMKNDMNFVAAVLSLQADQSGSPEVAEALRDARQRVAVMADIYKGIYSGSSLEEVDLASVVREVNADLRARGVLSRTRLTEVVEPVLVPVRISVAAGVILNELVTNAAKYAQCGGSGAGAEVRVDLRPAEVPHVALLTVQDNGTGFPSVVVSGERHGFGLTIVRALVEQYDGSLSLRNEPGATVAIRL